jgi:hypothetical protein
MLVQQVQRQPAQQLVLVLVREPALLFCHRRPEQQQRSQRPE